MCLKKSFIHKNDLDNPFIAKNNIVVYKALDTKELDGSKHICTPYKKFPIIFFEGKCVMNEPNMDIKRFFVNRGIHAYTTEQQCKKTCNLYYEDTGTKKFWAVIPKGSSFFVGEYYDIVSDNLIIFKSREEFRKYKKENKCVNLNLELSK